MIMIVNHILRENEIVLATIFLTTMKFKYLQVLQSNKNESNTEYYKNIVTATYVNY